ncbi:MAG: hypothetical protein K2P78_05120, partial [Gemmataceae bacterium]|nr:hypothetical protein [Gemmataceae bacterium]
MTDPATLARPAPRWFHLGMWLTLGIVLFPLVLGQLVTSLRAGMADPKWPTEPWYLLNNYRFDVGYLVEHSHRIGGFALGTVYGLLVLGAWLTDPRPLARWAGLAGLVVLLGAFAEFHRAVRAIGETDAVVIPPVPVVGMLAGLGLTLAFGIAGMARNVRGSGLRVLAVVALVAVMVQGLLGGTRVLYNALSGPQLAAVHGTFAQVVFALLVALTVLSGRRPTAAQAPRGVRVVSVGLVALLFVQLVLGVLVRHLPTAVSQRLHLLTAFVVFGTVVWLVKAVFASPAGRGRAYRLTHLLSWLVLVQVALGVEAWMGKFGAYVRPELEVITPGKAAVRTAHVLVGTLLLGTAVAAALRLRWGTVAAVPAARPAGGAAGAAPKEEATAEH